MAKLEVTLLSHTIKPEVMVACGAKLCYSNSAISNIKDGLTEEKTRTFLKMLGELGHESPFEHAYFTFGIEGVSRSLLAQLTRHRIASYSVKSQRYVREGQFDYVIPKMIESNEKTKQIFINEMQNDQKVYNELVDILKDEHMKTLLAKGIDEKRANNTAEKMAIEDARYVLPNSCETKIVMSINARSLFNFFEKRCCERAQWEIRDLADEMLKLVKEVAPAIFESCGPPCISKSCPEGKMSCGNMALNREKYKNL